MSRNAYHRIASTSKAFTSTVVLQLVGEGKLKLNDSVDRWLPGLVTGHGNDGTKITVRQLLGHSSGLRDYMDDLPLLKATTEQAFRRERFRTYRPEQLVGLAMRQRPLFEPGSRFAYSNTNYVLAGMVIKRVTGKTWQQEVHERIIEPLGLKHTIIPGTSVYLPQPHINTYQRLGGRQVDMYMSTRAAGDADSALISTPGDVNTFLRALLGGRLLKSEELDEMKKTVPATPFGSLWHDPGYGLGLMKRRLPGGGWAWFHGGGVLNSITDNGVTADGRRSVTVVYGTLLGPAQSPVEQAKASAALIDRALCAP